MRPGDPFETDELDELRAEQRRVLAWIPRWIMDGIEREDDQDVPEPTLEDDADRPHCELVLRRFVRDDVLKGEEDLIEKMRRSTEGQMLEAAVEPIARGWNDFLARDARESVAGSYMGEIDKNADEATRIRRIRRALLLAESLSA